MIIKVMTRKEPSFHQLLAYVTRTGHDSRYTLTHNLMDTDLGAIAVAFEDNARLLRAHVNGTVMFHDILSVTRSKSLGLERQKEILAEIARDYIVRRADGHLVFASLHHDQPKHLHYHFVISANPHGEWKRAHLSKPELRKLQIEMEARVLARYPELEQKPAMSRKASGPKLSKPGQELLRRTGKVPERQRVAATLAGIFGAAQSKDDLFAKLTDAHMELYRRGKTVGVRDLDTGRNHRLATLGLADAFTAMGVRLEAVQTKALATTLAAQQAMAQPTPQMKPAPVQITPSPPPLKAPAASPQTTLTAQQAIAQPTAQPKPAPAQIAPSPPTLKAPTVPVQTPSRTQAQPPSPASSTNPQEDPVNIFEFALNGISAIADALSITPASVKPVAKQMNSVRARVAKITKRGRTTKPVAQATPTQAPVTLPPLIPVPVHTKHVRHAVNNAIDPHLTPDQVRLLNGVRQTMPPDHLQVLNDVRQALIEERLAEMAEMRKEQEQQLNQQPGNRLKP